MSVSDDIKASIELLDEVSSSGVELKRAGKNYTGFCPFHDNRRTPAFVVFPDSQTWRCFGACDTGGDLFTFVMKRDNIDFKEAMQQLARKAGIELRPMSQHEQRAVEQRRAREEVFNVAMDFFRKRLGSTRLPTKELSQGLEYALYARGWDLETISAAGIGYFGKDWDGLRAFFVERGIDPECPAAVAFVGYRGDVTAWGAKYGIKPANTWIEAQKIPAMRPNMLLYPHTVRGRVAYISGRTIEEKSHWNLPDDLTGTGKNVFFNQCWFGKPSRYVVVVEGQADAITLGKWGIRAVALCGVNGAAGNERNDSGSRSSADPQSLSSDNPLLSELKRAAKEGSTVALGLDGDETGKAKRAKFGTMLQEEIGVKSTQIVVVQWGAKDPNDWLLAMQAGESPDPQADSFDEACARVVRDMISRSDTFLQFLVKEAKKDEEDDALRAAFRAMVNLDPFEIEKYKDWIVADLALNPRRFDALLKAARREAGRTDDGQPRYFIEAGRICVRSTDSQGGETIDTLTNFAAEIKADVLRDNGQDLLREFHVSGRIGKRNLTTVAVKAEDFSQMNWVLGSWGSQAIIEAGSRRRDQVRAAIQHLSRDVERKMIYTHTGWREFDGRRVFLSAAGAVGADDSLDIQVELDRDLELYAIPPVADNIRVAMMASLSFLDIAPPKVSFPLWAAVYMAPLRDWINLGFNIWVFGGSGAMKSTLVALAMNHYGEKFDDKHLPASFMDTGNRIEQKSFTAKDLLLVVDDYAPQKDGASAAEYKRTAQRIIRSGGNMTGRGRMSSDATAKATYVPRSVLVITGEDVPASESFAARLFVVEMRRGDVDKKKLSELQGKKAMLSHGMAGYLAWLNENWDTFGPVARKEWEERRNDAFQPGLHLRIPEAVAGLMVGLKFGLKFAVVSGALSVQEQRVLEESGWNALLNGAKEMSARVRDEKADTLFIHALKDWITQKKIHLCAKETVTPYLGGDGEKSEMLGWYDSERLYLLPEATYSRLCKHFREQGDNFPVSDFTLRKTLEESGMIDVDDKPESTKRRTINISVDGRTQRVLAVRRSFVDKE